MAFKFFVFVSLLAYTNAGIVGTPAVATYSAAPSVSTSYIHQAPYAVEHAGPVVTSYASSPVAIHAPTYGATHQSVERSLGGAQSISHYSKAIDSAFSSVRKYDTRITNDALTPVATYAAPAHLAYAAPAHVAPAVAYSSAPVVTKTYAPVAYSSAPSVSHSYIHHAQPVLAKAVAPVATYAAPAPITYAAPAPLIAKTYAAPAQVYTKTVSAPVAYAAQTPVFTKTVAAPVAYTAQAPVAYAAHAPVAYAAPGPVVTKTYAAPVTYAAQAPVVAHGPVVSKAAVAYSPATVVAHTTFTGLGTAYEW